MLLTSFVFFRNLRVQPDDKTHDLRTFSFFHMAKQEGRADDFGLGSPVIQIPRS